MSCSCLVLEMQLPTAAFQGELKEKTLCVMRIRTSAGKGDEGAAQLPPKALIITLRMHQQLSVQNRLTASGITAGLRN